MGGIKRALIVVLLFVASAFLSVGYSSFSDQLYVSGIAHISAPALPDVYITDVTPDSSAGVTVNTTNGTVMFASVDASGTATFKIDVINISDKTYVFDRVIDGAEVGIEGVYAGTDITYTLSGISRLDEVAPNKGTRSFNVTITVPRGVTAENFVLKFNFIEKTGTEVLPGGDEYPITFRYNNNQADKTIYVHKNDFVPRPDVPTRYGYTFTGWYIDEACTTAWNFDIDRVSGEMTLYAGWAVSAPTDYIVTLRPNNGEASTILRVSVGELIPSQDKPTREGYTFIGWYRDSACTDAWNFDVDKVYQDTTLYGGWEVYVPPVPPDCNITFKANNGQPDRTIIVLTGEFIPRPTTPIRAGYVFIGWYTDEACTEAWNFDVDKVEGHMTLYGGWDIEYVIEEVKHDITFVYGNGTANKTVEVEDGSLIPRPTTPTREGYTFIGWYTDEALSSGWNFDTDYPTSDMTLYGGWEKASSSSDELHSDFLGLVEALLSDSNNCLNNSNVIFKAVMQSLNSNKRPDEDAPILHCSVNSVSGGTMSAIATYANSNLSKNLHFIFEADPDPAYQATRMRIYMYYGTDIENAKTGDEIMVYQQIVSRGADSVWHADGTYVGVATVGNFYGGGNSGKDVKTINPYTWHTNLRVLE